MYPIKKVIIGLDLSELDSTMVAFADFLSNTTTIEDIYFVNVIKNLQIPKDVLKEFPNMVDNAIEERRTKMKESFEANSKGGYTDKVHFEVLTGKIADGILKFTKEENIDLIVMGRREKAEESGALSQRLARRAACSLLIIPEGTTPQMDRILVPSDFSGHAELAVEEAIAIAKANQNNTEIIIQNVFTVPTGYHYTGKSFEEFAEVMRKNAAKDYKKVVSAEKLAVAWLETRSERERIIYEQLCNIAHQIIAKGFSSEAITPGVTSTNDLVWWYRQEIKDLGLDTWFHPTVDIQRADPENFDHLRSFSKRPDKQIIQPGDLLHVDFGITYLRLNTDTQQHAYVLKPGEKRIPSYLVKAFEQGKKVQDHLTNQFKKGKTGNQMLAAALKAAKDDGLKPTIYTHPIGYHGHAAGPTIGLWDQQDGVPGSGDYPLYPNTIYSIELNAAVFIQEWNKEIRIMLEEEAFFDGKNIYYIDGRQESIYAIPRIND